MKLTRWTVVAALLVANGACGDAAGPTASAKLGPIRLSVSSSSPEVVAGSAVTFRVDVVNEGSEAVTLHFGDLCLIHPNIRNELGEIVLPPGGVWECPTVSTDRTLLPGQPDRWNLLWRGGTGFESALFQAGDPAPSLPAGKYLFTAELPVGDVTLSAATPITLK